MQAARDVAQVLRAAEEHDCPLGKGAEAYKTGKILIPAYTVSLAWPLRGSWPGTCQQMPRYRTKPGRWPVSSLTASLDDDMRTAAMV